MRGRDVATRRRDVASPSSSEAEANSEGTDADAEVLIAVAEVDCRLLKLAGAAARVLGALVCVLRRRCRLYLLLFRDCLGFFLAPGTLPRYSKAMLYFFAFSGLRYSISSGLALLR